MKQNRFIVLGMAALLLVSVMALAGCGGNDDPKALAKQTFDLSKEALAAILNPKKAAEVQKKAAAIEAKVAKLPEASQAIYQAELARLSGKALGDLFDAASKTTDGLGDLLNSTGNVLDAASKTTDSLGNLLNSAGNMLDSANKSMDALNKAARE